MSTPTKKQSSSTTADEEANPLEPVGSKFFGGAAEKEVLFDSDIEDRADEVLLSSSESGFRKFDDGNAFPEEFSRRVAMNVQSEINGVLYEEEESQDGGGDGRMNLVQRLTGPDSDMYEKSGKSMQWSTPLGGGGGDASSPLEELSKAMEYYNRIDVSVISAKNIAEDGDKRTVELRWVISAVWPNAWESRVVITGTSTLVVAEDTMQILKQTDALDNGDGNDMVGALKDQLPPRFWDVYHIGMSPSAELMQRLTPTGEKNRKGLFSKYDLFEIPSRYVLKPSMVDNSDGREMRMAQALPNHAFSCVIKTVGPRKQRYVATSPLEVQIEAGVQTEAKKKKSRITWTVAVPAQLSSGFQWPLPANEEVEEEDGTEDEEEENPLFAASEPTDFQTQYELAPRRLVATLPYGGNPQDAEVTNVRRQLYESVVRDNLKPKLDEKGRPRFFFLQNEVKTCFTEGGLGMAVYEWRPEFLNGNEVGIDLELD